jgi:hypothetical protein
MPKPHPHHHFTSTMTTPHVIVAPSPYFITISTPTPPSPIPNHTNHRSVHHQNLSSSRRTHHIYPHRSFHITSIIETAPVPGCVHSCLVTRIHTRLTIRINGGGSGRGRRNKRKGEGLGITLGNINNLTTVCIHIFNIWLITDLFCQLIFERTPTGIFVLCAPTDRVEYPRCALISLQQQ